jgi:diaminohydroxyphosphoribosylaminopyrimidine deaminase/5-amino-6-(5-phosphoribosylamino)uracil reductase
LISAGLVDEFVVYLAPKLIGQARDMASFGPLSELSSAVGLTFCSSDRLGPDLRIVARIQGRDQF